MFDESVRETARRQARANGNWIESIIQRCYEAMSEAAPKAMMIDGGAHLGRHTLPMAALPNVAKVVAVEGNDETFAALLRRVKDAPFAAKIAPVHAALQDDPSRAEVMFVKSPSHPGRSGINPVLRDNPRTSFVDPVVAPATTIDQIVSRHSETCRFIKLDLEGGEFAALKGGTNCLRTCRPIVFFENGRNAPDQNGYTIEDFIDHFEALDYRVHTIFGDPLTPMTAGDFWYAWMAPTEESARAAELMRSLVQAALATS